MDKKQTKKDPQEIIDSYRECSAIWNKLLDEESAIRLKLMDGRAENEVDSAEIRNALKEAVESIGLRDKQRKAIADLRDAERALFSQLFDQCQSSLEREELTRLSRDYAGRITYLKRYL